VNVGLDKLTPGVFGVSHGGGLAGELIRHATGSSAGHAFLYLGNRQIVQGQPPAAALAPAASHGDAIWAWRMWDQLRAAAGWTPEQVTAAQKKVVARGHALIGCRYDFEAYAGFSLEVLKLASGTQLDPVFSHDSYRVCSALVADAEAFGGVPLDFVPADGPGVTAGGQMIAANLVAPGMLLGLAERSEWL